MQILGIVLALIGVIYLWLAAIIPVDSWAAEEAINTRTLPMVYGFVFLLACWLLLIKGRGQADMTLGAKVGVRGTPTFFINGRKIKAREVNTWKAEGEKELKKK